MEWGKEAISEVATPPPSRAWRRKRRATRSRTSARSWRWGKTVGVGDGERLRRVPAPQQGRGRRGGRHFAQCRQGVRTYRPQHDFLNEHLGNSGEIFEPSRRDLAVADRRGEDPRAAMQIFGRGGEALIPIVNLGKEKIDELAETMAGLGATENDGMAETGRKFKTLSAEIDGAWEGIKKAVSDPILEYLADHIDEVLPLVKDLASELRQGVGSAMQVVGPLLEGG